VSVPAPFAYERPSTLEDALAALESADAAPLAGGTDFVTMRATGAIAPRTVVDLKRVEPLRRLLAVNGHLHVGAGVTMARLAKLEAPGVGALRDGAAVVGSPMTRNRATLGGNAGRASPAGDTLPALLATGAVARIASRAGERDLPVAELFLGPGMTALERGELLVDFDVPARQGGSAYRRLTYRAWMDLAVVGVAAWVEIEDGRCTAARVAFGGAAPTPLLVPEAAEALTGSALDDAALAAAADAVRAAAKPIDDVRGSRRHRTRALGVLARRVIATAARRATERSQ
jgi:carbon-monoxide dehydrogenase medium subunit